MPTVASAAIKQAKATITIVNAHITQTQIAEFIANLAKVEQLKAELNPLQKAVDEFEAQALTFATGLNKDQWKMKSPVEISDLMTQRLVKKDFTVEQGKLDFEIIEPTPGRATPAYMELLEKAIGSAELLKVKNNTPKSHSYHILPTSK